VAVKAALLLGFVAGSVRAQSATGSSSSSNGNDVVSLSPFEVSSGGTNTGYGAQFSSSSSRLNLRYVDIPQTVNVVTSEFLTDAFLFDSRDFAMHVPGMSPTSNTHQVETFLVRGLTTSTSYVDGFLSTRSVNRDSGLYDRTEYV
jgi:outer membrane receptor for ferric coprogen and ferric-rhodotorulic acid